MKMIPTLGVLLALTVSAAASDLKTIAESTLKLYDGDRGICSTTVVKNEDGDVFLLTAAHCTDGAKKVEKDNNNTYNLNVRVQEIDSDFKVLSESIYYVKPVKTIAKSDVALLEVVDPAASIEAKAVDVATVEEANSLVVGDRVTVVGFPAAELLSVTEGSFTGKRRAFEQFDMEGAIYQTSAPVAGGNSGGGLYAEFEGELKLIGVTHAMRVDNSIMTYYATAESVEKALKGFVTPGRATVVVEPETTPGSGLNIDER